MYIEIISVYLGSISVVFLKPSKAPGSCRAEMQPEELTTVTSRDLSVSWPPIYSEQTRKRVQCHNEQTSPSTLLQSQALTGLQGAEVWRCVYSEPHIHFKWLLIKAETTFGLYTHPFNQNEAQGNMFWIY